MRKSQAPYLQVAWIQNEFIHMHVPSTGDSFIEILSAHGMASKRKQDCFSIAFLLPYFPHGLVVDHIDRPDEGQIFYIRSFHLMSIGLMPS